MSPRKDAPQPERQPGQPWPLDLVAQYLSCSRRHVERLIEAGAIKPLKIGHRVYVSDAEMTRVSTQGTGQVA
jgi:excisionase family DNA binding protein